MTNLQALQSYLSFSANDLLLERILEDNDIIADETYTSENKDVIELCSAYVIKTTLNAPDFKEGSLSVKYDKKRMIRYANQIFNKNNLTGELITENKIKFI